MLQINGEVYENQRTLLAVFLVNLRRHFFNRHSCGGDGGGHL